MKFFGSRAVWTHNIANVVADVVTDAVADASGMTGIVNEASTASTSQLDECPLNLRNNPFSITIQFLLTKRFFKR